MPLQDLLIALSGILITSLPIVLVRVNFKGFDDDGSNEFIQLMLTFVFAFIQIEFWKILIFGMEAYTQVDFAFGWWPLYASLGFVLFVLHPIRRKIYPDTGKSWFTVFRKKEIPNEDVEENQF